MKFAASSFALPAFDHIDLLPGLRPLGLTGLEVVPSRTWRDSWWGLTARDVATYRYAVDQAGLEIIGLDGLLTDRPDLGLFKGAEAEAQTADFLVHLSEVCRDLGGRTLIWGGHRWRGDLSAEQAWAACRTFLEKLLPRIEAHGTVLCFSPLSQASADFCKTARECRMLVNHLDHPSFGLHLSAAVQAANADIGHAPFSAVRDRLDHFHADEPGLATLGTSGAVDHSDCRRHLAAISYRKWISLKQRETVDPLDGLAQGARHLTACYLREDNLAMRQRRRMLASHPHSLTQGVPV
jgi:sugar phosphate isomerase/epimerase